MTPAAVSTVWLQLVALLAVEVAVVALAVALVQRWAPSAVWRRAFWQVGVVSVLVLTAGELSGAARGFAGWVARAAARQSNGAPTKVATAIPDPGQPTAFHLDDAFRATVEERLAAQRATRSESQLGAAPLAVSADPSASAVRRPFGTLAPQTGLLSDLRQDAALPAESLAILGFGLGWLVGAALVAGRSFLVRCLFLVFRGRRRVVTDAAVLRRVQALAERLQLQRRVRVIEVRRLNGPIAFGLLRPTIGLPPGFGAQFDAAKQDAMLAHELAHLAARDPLWHLLADVATAALWWHPAVWWMRRQLHAASEAAADEASVLVAEGPRILAECLVELGARLIQPRALGGLGIAGFRSNLGRRVQRLMHLEAGVWRPPGRLRAALIKSLGPMVVVVVAVFCTAWVAPRALTKGDSMKTVQQNWKRSLATLALLATVNVPDVGAAASEPAKSEPQPPAPPAVNAPPPAALPTAPSPPVSAGATAMPAWSDEAKQRFMQRYGISPPAVNAPASVAEAFRRRYGLARSAPAAGPLEAKLEAIVLDEVFFDALPLSEVLKYLSEECRKHDPEKKGINFLINPNGPPTSASPAIDPSTGLPVAVGPERTDMSGVVVKFNLPLRNVRLKDVLDAVAKVAEKPVQYSVEEYAVVFSPSSDPSAAPAVALPGVPRSGPLAVRTFKMDTNTFVAGLESAFGIKVEPLAAAGSQSGVRSRQLQSALKALLGQLGVNLEVSGKAVFYNELTGVVMVRATVDDLEIVSAAMETLGGEVKDRGGPAGFGGGGMGGGSRYGGGVRF
jgi:beta-lactamase regulating signal transducer with metallopeptidase domain